MRSDLGDDGFTCDWRSVQWPIDLSVPPELVDAGLSIHGTRGNERYLLPQLWCFHLYPYEAAIRLGERRFPIRPGFAGTIPPNLPIEYEYQSPSPHLYVHFRTTVAREAAAETEARVPAMQDLGEEFTTLYARLEALLRGSGGGRRRVTYRIQAFVWEMLCRLAEGTSLGSTDHPISHPAVQYATIQIRNRLSEPLSVATLAREAGVSYSYLARLFGEEFGTTVVGYIRAERMRRAEHLLRYSTLPIKTIAAAVGIPDLHLFNKTTRTTLGASPSAIRRQAAADQSPPSQKKGMP